MTRTFFLTTIICLMFQSCKSHKTETEALTIESHMSEEIPLAQGAGTVVYKTNGNYSNNIPVTMDYMRTKIVSYPHPSDVYYNGVLAKPTALKNGYWLDNREISPDVAFTSFTYEEYAALKEAPSMDVLMSKVIAKYPLLKLYNCGNRSKYKDEVKELNELIDSGFVGSTQIEVARSEEAPLTIERFE